MFLLSCMLFVIFTCTPKALPNPVNFPDSNLKGIIEAELSLLDPTPDDMLF